DWLRCQYVNGNESRYRCCANSRHLLPLNSPFARRQVPWLGSRSAKTARRLTSLRWLEPVAAPALGHRGRREGGHEGLCRRRIGAARRDRGGVDRVVLQRRRQWTGELDAFHHHGLADEHDRHLGAALRNLDRRLAAAFGQNRLGLDRIADAEALG